MIITSSVNNSSPYNTTWWPDPTISTIGERSKGQIDDDTATTFRIFYLGLALLGIWSLIILLIVRNYWLPPVLKLCPNTLWKTEEADTHQGDVLARTNSKSQTSRRSSIQPHNTNMRQRGPETVAPGEMEIQRPISTQHSQSGFYTPSPSAQRVSTFFTDDDLRITVEQEVDPAISMATEMSAITATPSTSGVEPSTKFPTSRIKKGRNKSKRKQQHNQTDDKHEKESNGTSQGKTETIALITPIPQDGANRNDNVDNNSINDKKEITA